MQNHASSPPTKPTRPTVHIRLVAGRYHITISGPHRAYAVQRLQEAISPHRRYYCGDGVWSTASHAALVEWLRYERGVRVDWPAESEEHRAYKESPDRCGRGFWGDPTPPSH